jgi:hypothetical protein
MNRYYLYGVLLLIGFLIFWIALLWIIDPYSRR